MTDENAAVATVAIQGAAKLLVIEVVPDFPLHGVARSTFKRESEIDRLAAYAIGIGELRVETLQYPSIERVPECDIAEASLAVALRNEAERHLVKQALRVVWIQVGPDLRNRCGQGAGAAERKGQDGGRPVESLSQFHVVCPGGPALIASA